MKKTVTLALALSLVLGLLSGCANTDTPADNAETTALGAAYLAGLSTGFWKSTEELAALREGEDRFLPTFDEPMRAARLAAWHEAVSRVRS